MKNILFLILSISFYSCGGQKPDNRLSIGIIDSLYSPTLQENRKLWIYTPSEFGRPSQKHYPVLFLLDGDGHFYSVAGMVQQLSEINGNSICPDMVIVGILNTDRTRDLTPSNVTNSPNGNFTTSGGGEKFTKFIQTELFPYIEAHYPVSPYRMIIGHSLGGLFVINTLINHPTMFNAYVAIDPSLWWDNQKILKEGKIALKDSVFKDKSLFFAIANTMDSQMDTQRVVHDTTAGTLHIRSNLLFTKYMDADSGNGLHYRWKYYNDDSHGSVPLIAEYDALHFLFDFYKLPNQGNPNLLTPALVRDHYLTVTRKMGYTILPPENVVNNMGYVFLGQEDFEKAYGFFEMNIVNYPGSSNVYDSMGDYYVAKKDSGNAIKYFEKALTVADNPDTKRKLQSLKAQKLN